jgi:hypothetical protein
MYKNNLFYVIEFRLIIAGQTIKNCCKTYLYVIHIYIFALKKYG